MFRKVVICLILLTLIGFISCKKKNSADATAGVTDEVLNDIFGDTGEGGDFLDDTATESECGDGTCDADSEETVESCPVDCDSTAVKTNTSSDKLIVGVGSDDSLPIKELDEILVNARMNSSYGGAVDISFEISEGSEIVEVRIDEELENKTRYIVKGLMPGTAKLKFTATDSENAETVFEESLDVEVVKNEIQNKTVIEPSSQALVDKTEVTIIKKAKEGSGKENYNWSDTVITFEGSGEVLDPSNYTKVMDEENAGEGEEIEIYTFHVVGKFIIKTTVTDAVLSYSSDISEEITINEEVAGNGYLVDKSDPYNCMLDEECRRAINSSGATVKYGEGIVIVLDGKDNYTCSDAGLDDALMVEEISGEVPGRGEIICLISLNPEFDDQEFQFATQKVTLESEFSGVRHVTFYQLVFEPNPCVNPAEIVVENIQVAELVGGAVSSFADPATLPEEVDGETRFTGEFDQYVKISLKVLQGKGSYAWSIKKNRIDSIWGDDVESLVEDCQSVSSAYAEYCHNEEAAWEFECEEEDSDGRCISDTVIMKSRLSFERIRTAAWNEHIELQVADSCESQEPAVKKVVVKVKLPPPSEDKIKNLRLYADYYTHDIDEYCWVRFRVQDGSHWIAWTKQYKTSDPWDDDIHQQIHPMINDEGTLTFNDAYMNEGLDEITSVVWHVDDNGDSWSHMNYRLRNFYLMGKYWYKQKSESVSGEVDGDDDNVTVPLSSWKPCPYPGSSNCKRGNFGSVEENNTPGEYSESGDTDYPDTPSYTSEKNTKGSDD